ncbi:hypothetical protein V6U80_20140 [Micromonospora sp. CPCC 205543]
MKPHRTDLVSLAFGLIFVGLSVWWLLARMLGLALPPVGWFLAGGLLLIGLLGLVGALRWGRHADPAAGGGPAPGGPDRDDRGSADAPDPAVGWPAPLDDRHPDTHRFHAPDAPEVHLEGPESSLAPVWGPDEEPRTDEEPPYRPTGEADECPPDAVDDRPSEAVEDRPADARYRYPEDEPAADRGEGAGRAGDARGGR